MPNATAHPDTAPVLNIVIPKAAEQKAAIEAARERAKSVGANSSLRKSNDAELHDDETSQ